MPNSGQKVGYSNRILIPKLLFEMHNKNKGGGNFETAILSTTNCHAGAKDGMGKVTF